MPDAQTPLLAAAALLALAVADAAGAAPPPRAVTLLTPGDAAPVTFNGASADGQRVVFTTGTSLLPADGDLERDVYLRLEDGTLRLLSPGTATRAEAFAVADDARSALIATRDALVPADSGSSVDMYQVSADGSVLLRSAGDAAEDSTFRSATPDLAHVLFESGAVVPDLGVLAGGVHCYANGSGRTRLVSSGTAGENARCERISNDGTQALFTTAEDLDGPASGDDDTATDVYWRGATGAPELVSPGTPAAVADVVGLTPDGAEALFTTDTAPALGDVDAGADVFAHRHGSATRLVTRRMQGDARTAFLTPDGATLLVTTSSEVGGALAEGDGAAIDLYTWRLADGAVELRSPGTDADASPQVPRTGDRIVFATSEALVPEDVDGAVDTYEHRAGGSLRLITSETATGESFQQMTPDGSLALFTTSAALLPADLDGAPSLYGRRLDGSLVLVTPTGTLGIIVVQRISADGVHVVLESEQGLAGDADPSTDLFDLRVPAPTVQARLTGRNVAGARLACTATPGESEIAVSVARAWLRDGAAIAGQTGPTLVVPPSAAGHRIACRATATSGAGSAVATTAALVIRPVLPLPRIAPARPRVGQRLRCLARPLGATTVSRTWTRNGRPIRGAAAASYRAVPADRGKRLRCAVTARNAGGAVSATSAAVRVRPAARP